MLPRIDQFFDGTWRIIILVCAAMVWVSNSVTLWSVLPAFAAAFVVLTPLASIIRRHAGVWTSFLICLGVFLALSRFSEIEEVSDVASAMISLVVGLLPITMTFRERPTSYWLSVLNVTIISLGCIIITNELAIYVLLVLFIVLQILNLNAAFLMFRSTTSRQIVEVLPDRYFYQFLFALPIGGVATAVIFFSFPRVNNLALDLEFSDSRVRTGYTGSVSLRQGREIDESQSLALLIDHDDKAWLRKNASQLLLRGNSLRKFDGQAWAESTNEQEVSYHTESDFRLTKHHRDLPRDITLYREPSSVRALFYPGSILSISPPKRHLSGIFTDREGNFFRGTRNYDRFVYQIKVAELTSGGGGESFHLQEMPETLRQLPDNKTQPYELASHDVKEYLNVPDVVATAPYFTDLQRSVEEFGPLETLGDLTVGITLYFQRNFEASLINDFSSANTLQEFLTIDRRGHCEYFASAAVLLMRSFGVPSRIVLGYRGGIYNAVSRLVEVRELNAHAWVEYYVPALGWLPYDPTPLAPPFMTTGAVASLKQYVNAMSFWFNKYVVDYNRETQRNLFSSLSRLRPGHASAKELRVGSLAWFYQFSRDLALAAALVALAYLLFVIRSRRQFVHIPPYYRRFMMTVKRRGLVKEEGETYRAFHRRVAESGVSDELVRLIDHTLERELYAKEIPSDDVLVEIRRKMRR